MESREENSFLTFGRVKLPTKTYRFLEFEQYSLFNVPLVLRQLTTTVNIFFSIVVPQFKHRPNILCLRLGLTSLATISGLVDDFFVSIPQKSATLTS